MKDADSDMGLPYAKRKSSDTIFTILRKGAVIIAILIVILTYAFIEPYWIETKETDFFSSDIPDSFDGFKIVFVSDIHHGPAFSRDRVRSAVDRINGLLPDLILLGGDYVQRDPKYIQPCMEELGRLNAKYGVMAVMGNHDHWESTEETRKWIQREGITLLDNTSRWIDISGERIKIGGVGDLYTDIQDLELTVKDVRKEDFVILMSHNPDYAERLDTDRIDLMLSGHTHGGQVTFFGLWAPLLPSSFGQKYRTGLVETENTRVLVSNGVGTVTPPLRFFARPQINVIKLQAH